MNVDGAPPRLLVLIQSHMDDTDDQPPAPPKRPTRPSPTMEELKARFGRALRDQNFWNLMDELEIKQQPDDEPTTVVAFPSRRAEEAPSQPADKPGRLITGRFPKKGS